MLTLQAEALLDRIQTMIEQLPALLADAVLLMPRSPERYRRTASRNSGGYQIHLFEPRLTSGAD